MKRSVGIWIGGLVGLVAWASIGIAEHPTSRPVVPPATSRSVKASPQVKVVLASEVNWQQLNPKRGDKSPKAATLWGDRHGSVATGFLVKFVDGFASPPHIHNVSYRGAVIYGLVHNDDPKAALMWMPAGSFWTQPKGEVHITAAKGKQNVAYIEIERGPYLVLPKKKAFDSGERPVNVDASNLVWLNASDTRWVQRKGGKAFVKGVEIAFLWGKTGAAQLNGTFVKLQSGTKAIIHSTAAILRAVVIQGQLGYQEPGKSEEKLLKPSSYFRSKGTAFHSMSCKKKGDCTLYIRTRGRYRIVSEK